jgi:hypothetical protein
MNILTWKVTDPAFQLLTGAMWVIVPFPSDALNPDPTGAVGGNPDSDDPPVVPDFTYCAGEHIMTQFNGMAGNVVFISCHTPGSPMAWNLVDPDALNISGDDGLSAGAETYYGTNPNSADTDGDTFKDDREVYLGTDPTRACATTTAPNDEVPDPLPYDFNDNKAINGQDSGKYGGPFGAYNKLVSQGPFNGIAGSRFDYNGDGAVNGQDTGKYMGVFNTLC